MNAIRAAAPLLVVVLLAGCTSDTVAGAGVFSGASRSGTTSTGAPSSGAPSTGSRTPGTAAPTSAGASGRTIARFDRLTGTGTGIVLDPGFVRTLTAVRVTPAVAGTSQLTGRVLGLRVTGGSVVVLRGGGAGSITGTVQHRGAGLSLTAGGTVIGLDDLEFDLDSTPTVVGDVTANGKSVVRGAALFDLDLARARTFGATVTAVAFGVQVRLGRDLAALLNTVFRTTQFAAGLQVGQANLAFTGR